MIALTKSTKLAIIFGVVGIAVGIGITLAVQAQGDREVDWHVVEDSPISWEDALKNVQEVVRPTISSKISLTVGEEARFIGSARGGNTPYQFNWNFDDGYTSNLQNVTHSFESAGNHKVQLTATDAKGRSGVISTTVQVLAMPEGAAEGK